MEAEYFFGGNEFSVACGFSMEFYGPNLDTICEISDMHHSVTVPTYVVSQMIQDKLKEEALKVYEKADNR